NALTAEQLQAIEAAKERYEAADSIFKRYQESRTDFNLDASIHAAAYASVHIPQLLSIIADLRAALAAATARAGDNADEERDRLRAALKPFATMWTEYQQALRDDAYYQGDLFDWLLHSVTEHAPQLDAYCERAADALAGDGE